MNQLVCTDAYLSFCSPRRVEERVASFTNGRTVGLDWKMARFVEVVYRVLLHLLSGALSVSTE